MFRSFYRNLSPALLLILVALVACIAILILTWGCVQRLPVTVPVTFTSETERQRISLGSLKQPGQYVLQLANDNPPYSSHWLEWDYLALEAGGRFLWWIGQDESSPDSDEFCGTAAGTDCRTGFEAGKIDKHKFPKTLNDGEFPVIRIAFTVMQEQTGADLILTLSTWNSSFGDTKDFEMQVTLQGPF